VGEAEAQPAGFVVHDTQRETFIGTIRRGAQGTGESQHAEGSEDTTETPLRQHRGQRDESDDRRESGTLWRYARLPNFGVRAPATTAAGAQVTRTFESRSACLVRLAKLLSRDGSLHEPDA
jgi:hypothetical protein